MLSPSRSKPVKKLLAFVIALALLFESLSVVRAESESGLGGLKNAVYLDTASGPDGSRVSAWVLWDEMVSYNTDRTFYPGDALRVRVTGNRTDWYEDHVVYTGAVKTGEFGIGKWFDQKMNLQISTEAKPGLRDISFALIPRKGHIDILAVDENGSRTRDIYIGNVYAGTGHVTKDIEQGTYTISFGSPPENVRAPPEETVTITPTKNVTVTGHYEYENSGVEPYTDVYVAQEGAPNFLPQITATLRVYIVPYNPRFVIIPYLWLNWRQDEVSQVSYDLPFVVLVRYDGNQFDPENENALSLDERCVVDGVSMQGGASWPLWSRGEQQRHRDNGDLDYYENGDPVMYHDQEKIRDDSGVIRLETADVSVTFDRMTEGMEDGLFLLTPQYHMPENIWENIYSEGHSEDPANPSGRGPFSWLRFDNMPIERVTQGSNKEEICEFSSPIVFDHDYRYHKFVFDLRNGLSGGSGDIGVINWIRAGYGTLTIDVSMWSIGNSERALRTGIEWAPLGLHQPVAVRTWRLAPWAREAAGENARVLYLDNAWMVDNRVSFEMNFVPMVDTENFLRIAHSYAKNTAPFFENLNDVTENLSKLLENVPNIPLGIRDILERIQDKLSNLQQDIPFARATFYSLVNLDDNMISTIVEDTGTKDAQPQRISGSGEALATIERRGLSYFAVEERAWLGGENVQMKSEVVNLPFDNEKEFAFDINLSGEGMMVEVVSDTSAKLVLRIHAPPKSGGLERARILDNRGNLLYQRDFLPLIPSQLSVLGPLFGVSSTVPAESSYTLAFDKTPSTPTEISVELTNTWGASNTRELTLVPWVSTSGAEMNIWGWLIAAGIFIAAWVAFVNWLKEKKVRRFL